ncbi:MAG TPA: CBS domain-containing protein, partial [Gemmatimonadales bacterium]|jgi:CBS domain-containing protein
MLPAMHVGDLMQLDLAKVRPEDTVKDVVSVLATAHVSGLPVVDDDGRIVGVVSASDIIAAEAAMADHKGRVPLLTQTAVRDIMSPRPYTIGPAADVREVARHMHYAGIHRVFVTKEERLLGVISASDIVRAVATGTI